MRAVSSRATRRPEIEVPTTAARHSFVTSSITLKIRNRRPWTNWSWIEPWSRHWSEAHGEGRPTSVRSARPPSAAAPGAGRLLPSPPLAHRQAFLPVEPLGLLAVHDMAFSPEQNVQPKVTEPTAFGRPRPQALAQIRDVGASAAVADGRPIRADHGTCRCSLQTVHWTVCLTLQPRSSRGTPRGSRPLRAWQRASPPS